VLLGYFGKNHQFAVVVVGGAGLLWSQCSLDNAIKQHEAREIVLAADQLREEFRTAHDLLAAQLKEEARSDMNKLHKKLTAKSEIIPCIPLGLVYVMMMALYTKEAVKQAGRKESEKYEASRAVNCNPVKEIEVVDRKGAECNK